MKSDDAARFSLQRVFTNHNCTPARSCCPWAPYRSSALHRGPRTPGLLLFPWSRKTAHGHSAGARGAGAGSRAVWPTPGPPPAPWLRAVLGPHVRERKLELQAHVYDNAKGISASLKRGVPSARAPITHTTHSSGGGGPKQQGQYTLS